MNVYLIGKGAVGTALSNFLSKRKIDFQFVDENIENREGILFLPVSDSAVKPLSSSIFTKNRRLFIVHFSAAAGYPRARLFLLHPFSSVTKESDFSKIFFTLWGFKDEKFNLLFDLLGLNYKYCGTFPTLSYHAAAVLSGNFAQYFSLAAIDLLKSENFTEYESKRLITQLVNSSLENIFSKGVSGITGPAARGEKAIILNEFNELRKSDRELAEIFKSVNEAIERRVKGGDAVD